MPAILEIADRHKLHVIEDCAQAFGATGDTWKIGELSDAVCTSFITAKNLGCFGDGGGVVTNREDLVEPIMRMRNHGSIKRSHHSGRLEQPAGRDSSGGPVGEDQAHR